jgi:hypothetical protein
MRTSTHGLFAGKPNQVARLRALLWVAAGVSYLDARRKIVDAGQDA